MNKKIYLYILKCSDQSYYTGVTNDLGKRLWEHQQGMDKSYYTYSRRPVQMIYQEDYENPLEAIQREKQIKGWSRRKKEALIQGDWEKLKAYSRSGKSKPE
jgi:putative endonuclease